MAWVQSQYIYNREPVSKWECEMRDEEFSAFIMTIISYICLLWALNKSTIFI